MYKIALQQNSTQTVAHTKEAAATYPTVKRTNLPTLPPSSTALVPTAPLQLSIPKSSKLEKTEKARGLNAEEVLLLPPEKTNSCDDILNTVITVESKVEGLPTLNFSLREFASHIKQNYPDIPLVKRSFRGGAGRALYLKDRPLKSTSDIDMTFTTSLNYWNQGLNELLIDAICDFFISQHSEKESVPHDAKTPDWIQQRERRLRYREAYFRLHCRKGSSKPGDYPWIFIAFGKVEVSFVNPADKKYFLFLRDSFAVPFDDVIDYPYKLLEVLKIKDFSNPLTSLAKIPKGTLDKAKSCLPTPRVQLECLSGSMQGAIFSLESGLLEQPRSLRNSLSLRHFYQFIQEQVKSGQRATDPGFEDALFVEFAHFSSQRLETLSISLQQFMHDHIGKTEKENQFLFLYRIATLVESSGESVDEASIKHVLAPLVLNSLTLKGHPQLIEKPDLLFLNLKIFFFFYIYSSRSDVYSPHFSHSQLFVHLIPIGEYFFHFPMHPYETIHHTLMQWKQLDSEEKHLLGSFQTTLKRAFERTFKLSSIPEFMGPANYINAASNFLEKLSFFPETNYHLDFIHFHQVLLLHFRKYCQLSILREQPCSPVDSRRCHLSNLTHGEVDKLPVFRPTLLKTFQTKSLANTLPLEDSSLLLKYKKHFELFSEIFGLDLGLVKLNTFELERAFIQQEKRSIETLDMIPLLQKPHYGQQAAQIGSLAIKLAHSLLDGPKQKFIFYSLPLSLPATLRRETLSALVNEAQLSLTPEIAETLHSFTDDFFEFGQEKACENFFQRVFLLSSNEEDIDYLIPLFLESKSPKQTILPQLIKKLDLSKQWKEAFALWELLDASTSPETYIKCSFLLLTAHPSKRILRQLEDVFKKHSSLSPRKHSIFHDFQQLLFQEKGKYTLTTNDSIIQLVSLSYKGNWLWFPNKTTRNTFFLSAFSFIENKGSIAHATLWQSALHAGYFSYKIPSEILKEHFYDVFQTNSNIDDIFVAEISTLENIPLWTEVEYTNYRLASLLKLVNITEQNHSILWLEIKKMAPLPNTKRLKSTLRNALIRELQLCLDPKTKKSLEAVAHLILSHSKKEEIVSDIFEDPKLFEQEDRIFEKLLSRKNETLLDLILLLLEQVKTPKLAKTIPSRVLDVYIQLKNLKKASLLLTQLEDEKVLSTLPMHSFNELYVSFFNLATSAPLQDIPLRAHWKSFCKNKISSKQRSTVGFMAFKALLAQESRPSLVAAGVLHSQENFLCTPKTPYTLLFEAYDKEKMPGSFFERLLEKARSEELWSKDFSFQLFAYSQCAHAFSNHDSAEEINKAKSFCLEAYKLKPKVQTLITIEKICQKIIHKEIQRRTRDLPRVLSNMNLELLKAGLYEWIDPLMREMRAYRNNDFSQSLPMMRWLVEEFHLVDIPGMQAFGWDLFSDKLTSVFSLFPSQQEEVIVNLVSILLEHHSKSKSDDLLLTSLKYLEYALDIGLFSTHKGRNVFFDSFSTLALSSLTIESVDTTSTILKRFFGYFVDSPFEHPSLLSIAVPAIRKLLEHANSDLEDDISPFIPISLDNTQHPINKAKLQELALLHYSALIEKVGTLPDGIVEEFSSLFWQCISKNCGSKNLNALINQKISVDLALKSALLTPEYGFDAYMLLFDAFLEINSVASASLLFLFTYFPIEKLLWEKHCPLLLAHLKPHQEILSKALEQVSKKGYTEFAAELEDLQKFEKMPDQSFEFFRKLLKFNHLENVQVAWWMIHQHTDWKEYLQACTLLITHMTQLPSMGPSLIPILMILLEDSKIPRSDMCHFLTLTNDYLLQSCFLEKEASYFNLICSLQTEALNRGVLSEEIAETLIISTLDKFYKYLDTHEENAMDLLVETSESFQNLELKIMYTYPTLGVKLYKLNIHYCLRSENRDLFVVHQLPNIMTTRGIFFNRHPDIFFQVIEDLFSELLPPPYSFENITSFLFFLKSIQKHKIYQQLKIWKNYPKLENKLESLYLSYIRKIRAEIPKRSSKPLSEATDERIITLVKTWMSILNQGLSEGFFKSTPHIVHELNEEIACDLAFFGAFQIDPDIIETTLTKYGLVKKDIHWNSKRRLEFRNQIFRNIEYFSNHFTSPVMNGTVMTFILNATAMDLLSEEESSALQLNMAKRMGTLIRQLSTSLNC